MSVMIGSARIDENGNIVGGVAGDQTEKEVCQEEWYKHSAGWVVLRAKSATVRNWLASCMSAACDNNNFGYDQNQRNTAYTAAKAVGFDPTRVGYPVECDCSSLVRLCLAYAGIQVGDFYTGNEVEVIMGSGQFEKLTDKKYTDSPDYLVRGDILVTKKQGHTAIVITSGSKTVAADTTTAKTKSIDELAREVIAGKYGNGDERAKALGSKYNAVQERVNEILRDAYIDSLAQDVIDGKYGTGAVRKSKLGGLYSIVQKRVNEILSK